MNLFGGIRRFMSGVVGVVIASIGVFACGAVSAFVLSPQAALEWRRIESLPILDVAGYADLAVGSEAAITGTLADNQTLTDEGLVAYKRDVWHVRQSSSSSSSTPSKPTGSWETTETNAPVLAVAITGGTIKTLPVTSVNMGGSLHETVQAGTGSLSADYQGKKLSDGSVRTQGFNNGDLITLVGHKGSTGDLIPDRMFGGDRIQLVASIRQEAQFLFIGGIAMMICAPIVLVGGLIAVLTGRARTSMRLGG